MPKKVKKNNLSLENINKTISHLDENFTIKVKDRFDNEYDVIINKYFKKSDVNNITGTLIQMIGEYREENGFVDVTKIMYIYPFLLVKYFTNIPIPDKTIEIINYAKKLVELDIVGQVMDNIPSEEMEKVNKWIEETINVLPEYVPQLLDIVNKNDLTNDLKKEIIPNE